MLTACTHELTPDEVPGAIKDALKRLVEGINVEEPLAALAPGEELELRVPGPAQRSVEVFGIPVCTGDITAKCITASATQDRTTIPVVVAANWEIDDEPCDRSHRCHLNTSEDSLGALFSLEPPIKKTQHLGSEEPPFEGRKITVTVTATAKPADAQPAIAGLADIEVSKEVEVPIEQQGLALPTIVAMFVDSNFGTPPDTGAYVVIETDQRLIDCEPLLADTLGPVSEKVDILKRTGDLATFWTGLGDVVRASRFDRSKCRTAASVANFMNDQLKPGVVLWIGQTTAEDSISSLMVLGAEGEKVDFFNDRGWNDPHTHFTGRFPHNKASGWFTITVPSTHTVRVTSLSNGPAARNSQGNVIGFPPISDPPDALNLRSQTLIIRPPFAFWLPFNEQLSALFFDETGRELRT